MTVDVARRRTRKPKIASVSESLAIGEIDQTVFACPACARPLALGARHCPGCGTRLILGVQAQRASLFVGLGLVGGIVLSGLLGATASALDGARRDAEAAAAAALEASNALPSLAPTAVPSASPSPSIDTGSTSTVPAITPLGARPGRRPPSAAGDLVVEPGDRARPGGVRYVHGLPGPPYDVGRRRRRSPAHAAHRRMVGRRDARRRPQVVLPRDPGHGGRGTVCLDQERDRLPGGGREDDRSARRPRRRSTPSFATQPAAPASR